MFLVLLRPTEPLSSHGPVVQLYTLSEIMIVVEQELHMYCMGHVWVKVLLYGIVKAIQPIL